MSSQRVLVLTARDDPLPGVVAPTTREHYRSPQLGVQDRDLGLLAPDDIRVQMIYAGVCGSDVHIVAADSVTGYVLSSVPAVIPEEGRVLGHEGVGRVEGVGERVRHLDRGDVVTFASIVACGACDPCKSGAPNQCTSSSLVGMQRDGVFGSVVDIPAQLAHRVDSAATDADLQAMACVEPAANAHLACETGDIGPADTVAIFGGGPLGLFSAMVSRQLRQAGRVIVVEPRPVRRAHAAAWCDAVRDVDEFLDDDEPVDVMIEASGDMTNVTRMVRRMKSRGRIVLLGRSGDPLVVDDVDHLISQAITIHGCRGHLGGAIDEVIRAVGDGSLPLAQVVTTILDGLDDLADALRESPSIGDSEGKVLVRLGTV